MSNRAASPTRYVADAANRVTWNPQFMAMNIASVAPTTEKAPFMPQAHGTICGVRGREQPDAGRHRHAEHACRSATSVATASAIRAGRANGIAHCDERRTRSTASDGHAARSRTSVTALAAQQCRVRPGAGSGRADARCPAAVKTA